MDLAGMDISGSVAVVTGGASGIGKAIASALVANGAKVVVGDVDAASWVDESDAAVVAVRADASDRADIASLLSTAERAFGPVDIYVANAGIIGSPGIGDDAAWDTILDVNLRSHIRAAELIVPQWQSRGRGHFVSVASAAGLLTQLGAAGYAVTKHAAVGFAEWLAITYGDDGIGVTCVCPLGVDTPLLDAVRSATDTSSRVGAASIVNSGEVLSPDDVATQIVDAIRANQFLVLPHPQVLRMYQQKGSDYARWIAGMQRYQRTSAQ